MTTPKTYGPEGKTLGQIACESFDERYKWTAQSKIDQLSWQEVADAVAFAVEPKWISVKERLPETNDYYLVWVKSLNYEFAALSDFGRAVWWIDLNRGQEVTHWMPLPQLPTK